MKELLDRYFDEYIFKDREKAKEKIEVISEIENANFKDLWKEWSFHALGFPSVIDCINSEYFKKHSK